jgi:transposase-like protein
MAETQTQKKKRKKQLLSVLEQVREETAIQNAAEVAQVLEELEARGIRLDVQVCPKCKSPKVQRTKTAGGDMLGHMGILPPKYECPDCGWQERVVVKATNRPVSVRDVELTREAMDTTDDQSN